MPICAYPAAPTTDLETVLGRLHGSQLPEWAEYDGEFDPGEGREAFDRYVERYRTSTEAERRSFFPGSTYALHELRLGGDGGPRLDCKPSRYFTSLATSEDLDEELMAALAEDPVRPVPLERLDRRRWLHDRVGDPVVDGRHHSAAVSHGTVVMLTAGGGTYDVLLPHRSQHVATHSHFNHIAPLRHLRTPDGGALPARDGILGGAKLLPGVGRGDRRRRRTRAPPGSWARRIRSENRKYCA
ncbi:hypothetical protein [Streptomyces erythrochromogenes]|uniref:hypothetical protein n=1 Tax=Streptomyces erythrochromogenes TaxID=285574 RepID=UPI0038033C41